MRQPPTHAYERRLAVADGTWRPVSWNTRPEGKAQPMRVDGEAEVHAGKEKPELYEVGTSVGKENAELCVVGASNGKVFLELCKTAP